jgi:hypothetical protein
MNILPDAGALQKNPLQQRQLKEYVVDILKRLRDELHEARVAGKYELTTTIPIQYDVSNMDNSDSQRIVFSSVIRQLLSQEYTVKIHPDARRCKLFIKWISEEDEKDIADQIALIASHTSHDI